MRRSSRSGFTLIEILIVVGIIAILVVVLLAVVLNARKKGDIGMAKNFATTAMAAAMEKWQQDNGKSANTFPPSPNISDGESYWQGNAELFKELVTEPKKNNKAPYISDDVYVEGEEGGKPVFLDPWNNFYIYRNVSVKRTISGRGKKYAGKRYNEDTYDVISKGPDGQLYEVEGENDDIHNGSE